MNGLNLQCERSQGSWKDGLKENVLCIVDQDHQSWAIAVDHTSKIKATYLMVNPPIVS